MTHILSQLDLFIFFSVQIFRVITCIEKKKFIKIAIASISNSVKTSVRNNMSSFNDKAICSILDIIYESWFVALHRHCLRLLMAIVWTPCGGAPARACYWHLCFNTSMCVLRSWARWCSHWLCRYTPAELPREGAIHRIISALGRITTALQDTEAAYAVNGHAAKLKGRD